MKPAICRPVCGTYQGLWLHQDQREPPCSRCLDGEAERKYQAAVKELERELIPTRPKRRGK